jgi:aspartate aminotransferase
MTDDIDIKLAPRMERMKPSPTVVLNRQLRAMRAAGKDIIGLNIGEPDLITPEDIRGAAKAAIDRGETKYTNVDGTAALKAAIQTKLKRENGLDYASEEIGVSVGAKHVIFQAILATVAQGDEVVIPTPCWVSYPDIVQFAGGTPILVPPIEHFRLPLEGIRAALTPRSRWLILNNPNNPTGVVYTREELLGLAAIMRAHPQLLLMSDDIYEHLLFDGRRFHTLPEVAPDLKLRTLVVNGVSKTYAMTGWRIGYGVGHRKLIAAIAKIQGQSTSGPSSISQAASAAALAGDQRSVEAMRATFERRRDLVARELRQIPGLDFAEPEGAFYVWIDCRGLLGKRNEAGQAMTSDETIAVHLLEHGVGVVPGTAYLHPGFFRICFAASDKDLLEGARRIRVAVGRLR